MVACAKSNSFLSKGRLISRIGLCGIAESGPDVQFVGKRLLKEPHSLTMSTHTAIYVHSFDEDKIKMQLALYLEMCHPTKQVFQDTLPCFPGGFYLACLEKGLEVPTMFAVRPYQQPWILICYNCFSEMRNLAEELSKELGTKVLVVIAQTNSDRYYLGAYQPGYPHRAFNFPELESLEYCCNLQGLQPWKDDEQQWNVIFC